MDRQPNTKSVTNQLYEYDSWLDEISVIADMGCGPGYHLHWWASLMTRDDPPAPHNYLCYGVDHDPSVFSSYTQPLNILQIVADFDDQLPTPVDLIWSCDSLQYSKNPLNTLLSWNKNLNENGTLVLIVPQHTNMMYNRFSDVASNGAYFHYTITSLIYMLGTCGFDCSKMYALKKYNDPWLYVIVRKSNIEPLDPHTTSLYTLFEKGLLDKSAGKSVLEYGCIRADDLLLPWLDRNLYRIDYTDDPEIQAKPTLPGPIFRESDTGTGFLRR